MDWVYDLRMDYHSMFNLMGIWLDVIQCNVNWILMGSNFEPIEFAQHLLEFCVPVTTASFERIIGLKKDT